MMHIETIPVKVAGDPFFTVNCYLVAAAPESDCVLALDPGDEAEVILEHLGNRTLSAIILTHGHYDHIGGIHALVEATGAKTYAQEEDAELIANNYDHIRKSYGRIAALMTRDRKDYEVPELASEAPVIDVLLKEGDELTLCDVSLQVMHTPGHSAGSICLYSAEDAVLFSGDTLFKGTCGRTDLMRSGPQYMHDSLARLSTLPPETVVYPGHDASTTIGEEINRGLSEY